MNIISKESLADVEFQLDWKSPEAVHKDIFHTKVNFWRDMLPSKMADQLIGRKPGHRIEINIHPGRDMGGYDLRKVKKLNRVQFNAPSGEPRYGRFYPSGILRDVTNVFAGNVTPFRCMGIDNGTMLADFNHPLSSKDLKLTAIAHNSEQKPYDRGGECAVVLECIIDGPGMQIRQNGLPTDFFSDHAFDRADESDDPVFYQQPRLVNHLDDKAIETITGIYGSLLQPGMDVLDLMSGWRSHVPVAMNLKSLVGLGMNSEEMTDNPQLTGHLVHDVNKDPRLPFADDSFDRVICTVSVEYMTRPVDVFAEVARILKKEGLFILTFSNRWFPPKVIKIWTELHEFERMGLVMEYFHKTGRYEDLVTYSSRGLPRPNSDKYYPQMRKSDPVYAVWGKVVT
jgi:FKBP-type peptidyl-prolyl cis-trans isomerase 2